MGPLAYQALAEQAGNDAVCGRRRQLTFGRQVHQAPSQLGAFCDCLQDANGPINAPGSGGIIFHAHSSRRHLSAQVGTHKPFQ
jgi:hypothetical protein